MSKQRFNLVHVLARLNGAAVMGIDTETVPSLLGGKSNPMKDNVIKRHTGALVMLFQNKFVNGYEAAVKRRLVAEGKDPESFELGARKFGTRIPNTPIIDHNGELYLECIFQKAGKSEYFYMDQLIDAANVQGLKVDVKEGEQGGLEDKVIIRTFKLSSITAIRFNKEEYVGEFYYDESEPLPADLAAATLAAVSVAKMAQSPQTLRDNVEQTILDLQGLNVPADADTLTAEQLQVVMDTIGNLSKLAKLYTKLA